MDVRIKRIFANLLKFSEINTSIPTNCCRLKSRTGNIWKLPGGLNLRNQKGRF